MLKISNCMVWFVPLVYVWYNEYCVILLHDSCEFVYLHLCIKQC